MRLCLICGEIALSISIHLPPIEAAKLVKPVALPLGRARLAVNPLPTGSETSVNTIGIVRVSRARASAAKVGWATTTSGLIATSSAAKLRMRSASTPAQR